MWNQVFAAEAGYNVGLTESARLHSDSNSIGSKIASYNQKLFVKIDYPKHFLFQYVERQQDWTLEHPDDTKYVNLVYRYHSPGINYQTNQWKIRFSLNVLDIVRKEELYSRIEDDDINRFILPSLFGEYYLSNLFFEIGAWQENDFQAFNYHRYSVFIYQTKVAALGHKITDHHQIKINLFRYDRIYPENYDLTKDECVLQYRFINPFSIEDGFNLRELSVKYVETRYPTQTLKEFHVLNYFKFRLFSLIHFITYGLSAANYYTTYREGLLDYSLIEEENMEHDLSQTIEYAGFTRLFTSRFYFSWKYALEDSLTRNAYLNQSFNLQITYTF